MKPIEFRRQIFRDSSHWDHGLSYKLEQLNGGGVALFSRPTFLEWVLQADEALSVKNFAVDHCGRIFWIHRDNCQLYLYDPISFLVESMIPLAECSEGKGHSFGRMLSVMRRLWILDPSRSRLIALRTDTFQIIVEIPLTGAIDFAWGKDRLFVLDRNGIAAYDVNGSSLTPPRKEHQSDPVAIGADPTGRWIYLIDNDAGGFLRFNPDGSFADEIGKFTDAGPNFKPQLLAVHSRGNLFVCDGSSPVMHEFSPDGGYIGNTGDVTPLSQALGMTFGSGGDLYVGSPEGMARFSFKTGLAGNQGVFYSGTLDSGGEGNDCWHRLDLVADLDAGGTLDVSYATADDAGLASAVDNIIKQETPVKERTNTLEALLDWKDPDVLRAFSPDEAAEDAASQSNFRQRLSHSMLFGTETKRYLWLKLALSGLAPGAKAAVREMRVYYPRLSYLRYLPAVYQEDPASREFLQRFLSMFETVFSGLEKTIERIPEVFDPEHTPKEFLDWLAQWLDLGIEEDWSPQVKKRLIRSAASLYQKKGRPDGLVEFIEIVTGKRPFIRESFEAERPFILGQGSGLGLDTRVFSRPTKDLSRDQRTVLGAASLGTSRISRTTQIPINPFRAAANHFTLLLDLSAQEFQRHERGLHRIIRENSPAHVGYDIRLVSGAGLGPNMVLGVNFRVEDPQPFYIGHSSLGRSVLSGFSYGPELGIDATLAGRDCGSRSASAFSYGEQ
ncbi:MAG: phage tail protein [Pyrinomonadaceae bacterium]